MNDQTQSRPGVRLGLTALLGLLGVWLNPGTLNYYLHTLEDLGGFGLTVWLAATLMAVLILHRAEGVKTPWRLALFLVLALGLSRMGVVGKVWMYGDWVGFLYFIAIGVLLFAGGIFAFGWPRHREDKRPLWVCLVRAPAITLSAFLILIAAGLRRSDRPTVRAMLFRVAFAGFVFIVAVGSPINSILSGMMGSDYVGIPRWLGSVCFYFSLWAGVGCGVLYLLSPWPDSPRLGINAGHSRMYWKRVRILVVCVVTALVALAFIDRRGLSLIIGYSLIGLGVSWPLCLLFVLLAPWPANRWLPRLEELPAGDGLGPLTTVLLMAMPLVPLGAYSLRLRDIFISILTGRLFAKPFDRGFIGGALDQSSLNTMIWRFTLLSIMGLSYVVVVRWLSDRRSRLGYWAFTAPTVAIWLCLLSFMIAIHSELLKYIHAMGFTPLRIYGLGYLVLYVSLMIGFLRWAVRSPNQITKEPSANE